jgi:hypothetical protein
VTFLNLKSRISNLKSQKQDALIHFNFTIKDWVSLVGIQRRTISHKKAQEAQKELCTATLLPSHFSISAFFAF